MAIVESQNGNGAAPHAQSIIKVTNTTMVLPTNKNNTERPPCPLITFDLPYITFYYNQKLLLYKTTASEFGEIVGKMKEGLEAALNYFYPLAGRIAKDEEGVLVVECNGESLVGAEVVEAEAEGVMVEELAENDADENLLQEVVPYTGIMNLEGLHRPLLAVQVSILTLSLFFCTIKEQQLLKKFSSVA